MNRDHVVWLATRHGIPVGVGETPELAREAAGRARMRRCEVEPIRASVPEGLAMCRFHHFADERNLLETLLANARQERDSEAYCDGLDDLDAIERGLDPGELSALDKRITVLEADLREIDELDRQGSLLPPPLSPERRHTCIKPRSARSWTRSMPGSPWVS